MTPITPPGLIAADDDIVEAFIYGDQPWQLEKITVRVTKYAGSDDPQDFYFALHPEAAEEFAHLLLKLAGQRHGDIHLRSAPAAIDLDAEGSQK